MSRRLNDALEKPTGRIAIVSAVGEDNRDELMVGLRNEIVVCQDLRKMVWMEHMLVNWVLSR